MCCDFACAQPRKLFNLCQFMCLDRDGDGSISTEECMEMIMHRLALLFLFAPLFADMTVFFRSTLAIFYVKRANLLCFSPETSVQVHTLRLNACTAYTKFYRKEIYCKGEASFSPPPRRVCVSVQGTL